MSNLKRSVYFPEEMLREIRSEAKRQDRCVSWLIQKAWKLAHSQMKQQPSAEEELPVTPQDPPPTL